MSFLVRPLHQQLIHPTVKACFRLERCGKADHAQASGLGAYYGAVIVLQAK